MEERKISEAEVNEVFYRARFAPKNSQFYGTLDDFGFAINSRNLGSENQNARLYRSIRIDNVEGILGIVGNKISTDMVTLGAIPEDLHGDSPTTITTVFVDSVTIERTHTNQFKVTNNHNGNFLFSLQPDDVRSKRN